MRCKQAESDLLLSDNRTKHQNLLSAEWRLETSMHMVSVSGARWAQMRNIVYLCQLRLEINLIQFDIIFVFCGSC